MQPLEKLGSEILAQVYIYMEFRKKIIQEIILVFLID